jgi:Protein of unknown function (DUF3768)
LFADLGQQSEQPTAERRGQRQIRIPLAAQPANSTRSTLPRLVTQRHRVTASQPSRRLAMTTKTDRIRELNDELRQHLLGGNAVITTGIAALGEEFVARLVKTIAVFDDFCHANDPHEEHDFGSFEVDGHHILFKIDYYDKTFTYLSPDPSNPAVTERVITIMLAEEY